ncbi:PP-loop superfamily ATP-utilizing enzyme [Thraustotheca clavata]|uniref:Diphthine--ammonia ligase n=1 Tax=Thraustotheca clavata TaxID=74557 RepID=A0A1W0A1F0_9STRA|nr:PP-loop superfamily ATP-utilizing enzyme [Thraustotheca clavata]
MMAAVAWTGGKDCAMALYEAKAKGYDVKLLVTFAPENPSFRAHPLALMEAQAAALGMQHVILTIRPPNYNESYEDALKVLMEKYQIECLVTGDIDYVGTSTTNYMNERCAAVGMEIWCPLWQRPRESLIELIIQRKFYVVFSCVKDEKFTDASAWLGKAISKEILEALKMLHAQNGADMCGENGEYHTMVLGGPYFQHQVEIPPFTIESKDGLSCMKFTL